MTFAPKAYTNGRRTEIANSAQEEANLLWDGWWLLGTYTPPPSPDFVMEGELAPVAKSGAYADLVGKPVLAPVATSGAYADLSGKPTIPTAASLASAPELRAAIDAEVAALASTPGASSITLNSSGVPVLTVVS